ncbi:MAG: hypothetical protein LBE79_11625 [Tannerella sp.]|nr:hypothetical protein [Tannerella sp.]
MDKYTANGSGNTIAAQQAMRLPLNRRDGSTGKKAGGKPLSGYLPLHIQFSMRCYFR